MVQTIANPLDMNNTRVEFTQSMKENLALGHSSGKVVENWDIPALAGAGAIRSSTSDLAKFISANLGYMNSSLMEAMEISHQIRHDKAGGTSIAMAWHINKGAKGEVICHGGGTGGYRTFIGFVNNKHFSGCCHSFTFPVSQIPFLFSSKITLNWYSPASK